MANPLPGPQCGNGIPAGSPAGLCPRYMLPGGSDCQPPAGGEFLLLIAAPSIGSEPRSGLYLAKVKFRIEG
jgi:hypothetical protein